MEISSAVFFSLFFFQSFLQDFQQERTPSGIPQDFFCRDSLEFPEGNPSTISSGIIPGMIDFRAYGVPAE